MSTPLWWGLISAALFGASTPASKHLLEGLSPLLLAGLLYAGAALALAPSALAKRRAFMEADRSSLLRLLVAVTFGGVIGPVLLLAGLARAPAGSVALWLNLEVAATALIARFFFKEHLHRAAWMAIAMILAASAILSGGSAAGFWGAGLVALACLAWGLDNNLTAVLDRFTPAQIAFAKGSVAGTVNVTLALVLERDVPSLDRASIAMFVGALGYGLSLLLYIRAAQQLGAARSQLLFATGPAWGLAVAWLVLREPFAWQQLVAIVMMASAVWLLNRERHGHEHTHEPVSHTHWHRHDDGHHEHAHETEVASQTWHSHVHAHGRMTHSHEHRPDLHHRHEHDPKAG
jgi:drug/metabolite transporter (DMT)-like permease